MARSKSKIQNKKARDGEVSKRKKFSSNSKSKRTGFKKTVRKGVNSKQQKMKLEKKEKMSKRNAEEKNGGQKRKQEDEETPPTKRSKLSSGKGFIKNSIPRKKKMMMRRERTTSDESKELISKAKCVWEKLRRHDLKKEGRSVLIIELMNLVKDQLYELVLKHDTARIIQCLLKFGTPDMRTIVFEKLKDHVVELSKLKYAKFGIKALFKYCTPSQRDGLITSLYNHVHRLVRHKEGAEILEIAYNDYATAPQRSLLVQEFYGTQFALFKDNSGRGLGEILAGNPEQRSKLIGHMKQALIPLMDKSVVKHSIIHKAVLDFLLHADEKSRSELIESMREVSVEMLHTREGAKISLQCLWHGTTKDRKVLVKSFKPFVSKICKEEHGHLVMMGMFDCVDDTVLVIKSIISEMISSLEDLCEDRYGRRVLLYLLSPRSPQHFSKQFLQLLTPGDDNIQSKKPQDTRWTELREGISPSLIKLASEKAVQWACQKPLAPLLIQIVLTAIGDVTPIYHTLTSDLLEHKNELICDPCGHWVLKRILNIQKEGMSSFACVILDLLSNEDICSWTQTNRGCFVLSSLLMNEESRTRLLDVLKPIVDQLRGSDNINQGSQVLLKTFDSF